MDSSLPRQVSSRSLKRTCIGKFSKPPALRDEECGEKTEAYVRQTKAKVGQHALAQGDRRQSTPITHLGRVVASIAKAFQIILHVVIPISNQLPQSSPQG
jgi:hypothetical protein